MKFIETKVLSHRGPNEQLPSVAVDGTLLVGESPVAEWDDNHSDYGYDQCQLYPAYSNGQQSWLLSKDWQAAHGYAAVGCEEEIVLFEKGIELLIKNFCWDIFFKQE